MPRVTYNRFNTRDLIVEDAARQMAVLGVGGIPVH
jgi:hypothetical protein